ncbi:hypothetical protein SO802_026437 [Lithocarpus litseifolius]|uniref:Uncharacterized protein n=1 Tax=Lithocarpus litseifolius TaxID=425828 RepID=A0AAW2C021_9ROSI
MGIKVMVICEGELAKGDNGKGDRENGRGERIVGKGQRVVLKGELPCEGEPNSFVSPISLLGKDEENDSKKNTTAAVIAEDIVVLSIKEQKYFKNAPQLRVEIDGDDAKRVKFSLPNSALDEKVIGDEEYEDAKVTWDDDEVKDLGGLEQEDQYPPVVID